MQQECVKHEMLAACNVDEAYQTQNNYYKEQAVEYFKKSVGADMSAVYARFLEHIPVSGHILDAGCGSGRDTKYFHTNGYNVTAFDAFTSLANFVKDKVTKFLNKFCGHYSNRALQLILSFKIGDFEDSHPSHLGDTLDREIQNG